MRSPVTQAIEDTAMHTLIRNDLRLIRQRIESLYGARPGDHEDFQNGLNFAVSGIEQALGAVGDEPDDAMHAGESIDGIDSSLAELRIRLDTRSDAWIDDPAMLANLPLADHLLAQACALLTDD